MVIRDLGELSGDVLLFGGPYSNLQAAEALFTACGDIPRGNRICTGDVVAYCADPVATWDLVARQTGCVVAGNCEQQLATRAPDCGCGFEGGTTCDLLSRGWYPYADARVTDVQRAAMAGCPDIAVFAHAGRRVAVIHGGVTDIARFIWSVSPAKVFAEERAALEALTGPVDMIVAGHSGIAFTRDLGGCLWANAGVIGMPPHDRSTATEYAVLSADGVRLHKLDYPAAEARASMEAAGLRQGYHAALTTGVWPSEDVLTETLRH
ncbi:metallophosphoesterase [Cognatishimia sp. MH4019]|uniref:metallophosphoesterase family protein n=1 Tax=Cognatishimia sp. MH4019 TaxID=2854030 RepID=UPI001CD3521D|nr:metallophosphoesterase family protein [Cognatishimia sp. MH4019]